MSKKNKLIILASAFSLVAVLVFSLLLSSSLSERKEKEQKEQKEQKAKKQAEEHVDYLYGDDPFKKEDDHDHEKGNKENKKETPIAVSSLLFNEPEQLPNATIKGNLPVIIDASKNYLVFKGIGGYVYFYNLAKKTTIALEKDAGHIALSQDERFVFYTKKTDEIERIYYYDLEAGGFRGDVAAAPAYFTISGISYADGLLYYSYYEPQAPDYFYTHAVVFKDTNKRNYPISPIGTLYNGTSSIGDYFKGEYYVYDENNHALSWAQPWDRKLLPRIKLSFPLEKTHYVSQIEFNDKGDFLLVSNSNSPEKINGNIYLKDGQLTEFSNVAAAYWLTNDYILIQDAYMIFLYDVVTKKHEKFKTEIDSFVVFEDHIYLTNFDEEAFVITKK